MDTDAWLPAEGPGGPNPQTLIAVLAYGDHPDLLRRVLTPLLPLARQQSAVVLLWGCDLKPASLAVLDEMGRQSHGKLLTVTGEANPGKYLCLRWILEQSKSWRLPNFMWFDDDSYLTAPNPSLWLHQLEALLSPAGYADMVGEIWTQDLRGNQAAWINSRSWCTSPVSSKHKVSFAAGGWWAIRRAVLERYSWPDPDIVHNGGDVMLGELCRQQGLRLRKAGPGVRINADAQGRRAQSPPRGLSVEGRHRPVGFDYGSNEPTPPA